MLFDDPWMISGAGVFAGHKFRTGAEAGPTIPFKNRETKRGTMFPQ